MKDRIKAALSTYQPRAIEIEPGAEAAAVLVLLYEHQGRQHVIFQKRTDQVRDHKGQISFPGGAVDPEDVDLVSTALRETHEEIGVHPDHIEVLGQLDDMVTISNFRVTPFVGWLDRYPYEWRFSDEEVAYLLEVPLDHLRNPASLVPDRRMINGKERTFQSYQWGDDLIWGATARMLSNFLDVVANSEIEA
ncbi:MAG TPA: CoA pyrophosphatase [Tepidiformaceae bacterium]